MWLRFLKSWPASYPIHTTFTRCSTFLNPDPRHDACPLVQCGGKRETVGVRDAVLGLILRGLEDEAVLHRKYGESRAFDMRKDLDLFLVAEGPLGNIDDLAEIDGGDELPRPRTVSVLKEACDLLMSRFFLEELQECVTVEKERSLRGHL